MWSVQSEQNASRLNEIASEHSQPSLQSRIDTVSVRGRLCQLLDVHERILQRKLLSHSREVLQRNGRRALFTPHTAHMSDPFSFPRKSTEHKRQSDQAFDRLQQHRQEAAEAAAAETPSEDPFDLGPSADEMHPSIWSRMVFKAKERPYIGVGALMTLGVFGLMIRHRHDPLRLNQMGRWRITIQTATLFALLHGMYVDSAAKFGSPYPWEWTRHRNRQLGNNNNNNK
jgi:hypothetical protein